MTEHASRNDSNQNSVAGDDKLASNPDVLAPELTEKEAVAILEALLFASDEPVSGSRLRDAVPELKGHDLRKLVKKLNKSYENTSRSFRIESTAGGYQMFTLPEYANHIEKMFARRQQNRLSKKALETLAIIAYKQPVTRIQIEEIRGVNADGVVRTLLSRNLITIAGTAETPGTPYLYRTTRQFLEYFGLKNLKDLPKLKELDELIEADAELQEQVDVEILKEIVPQMLGIEENGTISDTDEKPNDTTEQASEQEKNSSGD